MGGGDLQVRGQRVFVGGDGLFRKIVTCFGSTVFFGGSNVSATVNDGSITNGSQVTFSSPKYVVSAGVSRLFIEEETGDPNASNLIRSLSPSTTKQSGLFANALQAALTGGGGSGAGGATTDQYYNVKSSTYGARGDGLTDDTTAIQNAINDAKTLGGTVFFPVGTYVVSTSLNADQAVAGFTLKGAGGGGQYQLNKSRILYTGSTTGTSGGAIHFNSSTSWEMCYLGFDYNNAAFTGASANLIQLDGNVVAGGDSQAWHIHHCGTRCTGAAGPYGTANSGLRLNKAIIGTINNCHFTGADKGILLADAGGGYVNVVTIADCTFNSCTTAQIGIGTADGEGIFIRGCTFEAGTNTPGIVGLTGNQLYQVHISDCWFGDASADYICIDGLQGFSNRGITIDNCQFNGFGTGPIIRMGKAASGWGARFTILNCTFICNTGFAFGLAGTTNNFAATLIGNNNVGTLGAWDGTGPPDFYYALGNAHDWIYDRQQRVEVDSQVEVENALSQPNKAGLVVAGNSTAGAGIMATLPGSAVGAVYRSSDSVRTVVQSPNISTGEVVLAAGTGAPTPVVRVRHGDKLSFYNVTPVVRAAAAVAASDPASTQTLANSLRTILINLGLAS